MPQKIVFIDFNLDLCKRVNAATGIEGRCTNIIDYQKANGGVIVSASNPQFTMGAGLDAAIKKAFPKQSEWAAVTPGSNKRIDNIIFAVTVDNSLKSNRKLIKRAISDALALTGAHETLLLSGLGCGIGGMNQETFVEILKECLGI